MTNAFDKLEVNELFEVMAHPSFYCNQNVRESLLSYSASEILYGYRKIEAPKIRDSARTFIRSNLAFFFDHLTFKKFEGLLISIPFNQQFIAEEEQLEEDPVFHQGLRDG